MFPVTLINDKAKQLGLEFLVIGGHAVNFYCQPRTTLDVDLLVRKNDRAKWCKLLLEEGFKLYHDGQTFLQFSPPYGVPWRVDLMLVNEETFSKLRLGARSVELLGIQTSIPKAEHLIAMKLHALKHGDQKRFGKDFIDLLSLIRRSGLDPRSADFLELIEKYGSAGIYERIIEGLGK